MPRKPTSRTTRARELRSTSTRSEGLLWSILRGRQLCDLKFRRQHPIGPYLADFACREKMLVVEIDGGYHNDTQEKDLQREQFVRDLGWDLIRFTDEEVEQDAELVAIAITKHLGLRYELTPRKRTGSGTESVNAPNRKRR